MKKLVNFRNMMGFAYLGLAPTVRIKSNRDNLYFSMDSKFIHFKHPSCVNLVIFHNKYEISDEPEYNAWLLNAEAETAAWLEQRELEKVVNQPAVNNNKNKGARL